MSVNFRVTALAGAIALALGGTAMANTTLDSTTTGDLFVNVVDATNGTSFLFDTGVSQASFNGGGGYSYNFGTTGPGALSDSNYSSFVAAEGGNDVIDYSVLSATKTTATPNVGTVFFTTNTTPSAVPGQFIAQAQTNIGGFFKNANLVTSTTANSAYITAANGNTWGQSGYEGAVSGNLNIPFTTPGSGDSALVGNMLNFYSESSNALRSATVASTLTSFAGTWDFAGGVATYSAVPLPTPVLLLLSGLGLMGAVSRRGKAKVVSNSQGA
jgi:hypothetical protein